MLLIVISIFTILANAMYLNCFQSCKQQTPTQTLHVSNMEKALIAKVSLSPPLKTVIFIFIANGIKRVQLKSTKCCHSIFCFFFPIKSSKVSFKAEMLFKSGTELPKSCSRCGLGVFSNTIGRLFQKT